MGAAGSAASSSFLLATTRRDSFCFCFCFFCCSVCVGSRSVPIKLCDTMNTKVNSMPVTKLGTTTLTNKDA